MIKKAFQFIPALVLSISSLLIISIPAAHAATWACTWRPQDVGNLMNDPNNWINCNSTYPGAPGGDTYNITFPAAANLAPVDNIDDMTVNNITFQGNYSSYSSGYNITSDGVTTGSNTITVTGNISDQSTGQVNTIDLGITDSGSQITTTSSNTQLDIGDGADPITIDNTLTLGDIIVNSPLAGTGTLIASDANYPADNTGVQLTTASPSFSGAVSVNQGPLFAGSGNNLTNASSVTVQSGGKVATGSTPGCITTGNLTLNGTFQAQLGGTTACTGYDQIQASGAVNVAGATLQLSLINGFKPAAGDSFTIIDNTGSGSVGGTFTNLATQGSTITVDGYIFEVSYTGNGGRSIVLTLVSPASASGSSATKSGITPKSPDAGLGLIAANPLVPLLTTLVAIASIIVIVRGLRPRIN